MTRSKKIISLLLALAILLSAVPFAAAEEVPGSSVLDIWADPMRDVNSKPMTRFWFPDAGAGLTNEDYITYAEELNTGSACLYSSDYLYSVVEIIHELYDAGFGGVELAMICDSASYSSAQAQVIGWGSPAWSRVMAQALYTANNLGDGAFKVDLTMTSHWPLIIDSIDPNDPQQQKGLVAADATAVDKAALAAEGTTRLNLPVQDTADVAGATFLFEDELVAATLVKLVDGKYDLATAVALEATEAGGYAVGVPESDQLVQVEGTWYDRGWYEAKIGEVPEDAAVKNVEKNDRFSIEVGLKNGRGRDYLDDWQAYYEVSNADILAHIGDDDGEWYIVPAYSRGTGQNFSGNGTVTMPYNTYAINYYTEDGAYAVIEYWENNILDVPCYVYNDAGELVGPVTVRSLMKESEVSAIFEDSLELNRGDTSGVYWSADMAEYWQEYCGYDVTAYIPALISSGSYTCSTDSQLVSNLSADFGNLKEELFNDKHCDIISRWAKADVAVTDEAAAGYAEYLRAYGIEAETEHYGACAGGGYRFQSGSDDFQTSLDVDIVEGDNSSYNGDAIRRMTGTVNIKDDNGYTSFEALTLTMNDTVFYGAMYEMNFCFSGGINRMVLHGVPYTQPFNSAGMNMNQWPGWTFMNYGCYDARQAYYNDLYLEDGTINPEADVYNWTEFITRNQALLQNTDEQLDFLVVSNGTSTFSRTLMDQGYHYNVTSEYGLMYDSDVTDPANIENGVMSAGRYNIRALVLNNLTSVDDPAVLDRLLAYADAGMTILTLNSSIQSVNGTSDQDTAVAEKWAALMAYENVVEIEAAEDVANYVDSRISYDATGVNAEGNPLTGVEAKALHDTDADVTYYYIWNGATTGYEKKSGGGFPGGPPGGFPFALAAETEDEDPELLYGIEAFNSVYGQGGYAEMLGFEGVRQTLTVTMEAAENEIPYLMDPTTGEIHRISTFTREADGSITMELDIAGFDTAIVALSADKALFADAELLYTLGEETAYELNTNWTLEVDSYTNGKTEKKDWIDDDTITITRLDPITLNELTLWDNIPGLESVSGVAWYTTTFNYDAENTDGAYLYYEHMADETARCQDMVTEVIVTNAEGITTTFERIDQLSERVDLKNALSDGENTITLKLVTTLAAAKQLNGNFMNVSSNQNYGLTAVSVVPYAVMPASEVTVELTGDTAITLDDEAAVYTVSVEDAINLATATISLSIDGDCMGTPVAEGLNGWVVFASEISDGVLTAVLGNTDGVTSEEAVDILSVSMQTEGRTGTVSVSLDSAVLSAYAGSAEAFVTVKTGSTVVTTAVDYSTYDVNQDGTVNQLDITRAQRFYGQANELADVNADGEVNIDDLILILNNYS